MQQLAADIAALCAKSGLPSARMIVAGTMGLAAAIRATLPESASEDTIIRLARCCADSLEAQIVIGRMGEG